MSLISFIIVSFVICFPYYIYTNWVAGDDLDVETFLSMLGVACIPVLNWIVFLAIWEPWRNWKMDRVLMKGRKNDSPDI